MNKIDITRIPHLETPVGIYGSTKQTEVGGVFCLGTVIVIAVA